MCMYVGGCPFTVGGEEGRRKGLKNSREMAIARALQISRKTGVGGGGVGVMVWAKVKPFLAGYKVLVAIKQKHRKWNFRGLPCDGWAVVGGGLPWWFGSKESICNAGDPGSIPGLGRSPGEGNGNPLQYSCLGNSMDRGA